MTCEHSYKFITYRCTCVCVHIHIIARGIVVVIIIKVVCFPKENHVDEFGGWKQNNQFCIFQCVCISSYIWCAGTYIHTIMTVQLRSMVEKQAQVFSPSMQLLRDYQVLQVDLVDRKKTPQKTSILCECVCVNESKNHCTFYQTQCAGGE